MTCHKCGKKVHINKYCRSKVNESGGKPPKNSANKLPEWFTKKPVVSDTKYLATYIMTRKKRSTIGAPLEIMVMVHGYFTGRMSTMSGKISKAISHLFVLPIPLPYQ